jgi:hypothetical protein
MLAAILLPVLVTGNTQPPADAINLMEPRIQHRPDEASATRSPWVDANGWKIMRSPGRAFTYHVKGEAAALAAAESFAYGAASFIAADAPGADAFAKMVAFLKTIPAVDLNPVADFGVIDDGSGLMGEVLNLLARMNLLYKLEKTADRTFPINLQLGTKDYPLADARNPSMLAHKIRAQMGDDHRSLRVYGSEVVIGRLLDGPRQGRVFLLNYGRPTLGLRVRVRGAYTKGELHIYGIANAQAADWTQDGTATEFTVPELRAFAVIDLSRN